MAHFMWKIHWKIVQSLILSKICQYDFSHRFRRVKFHGFKYHDPFARLGLAFMAIKIIHFSNCITKWLGDLIGIWAVRTRIIWKNKILCNNITIKLLALSFKFVFVNTHQMHNYICNYLKWQTKYLQTPLQNNTSCEQFGFFKAERTCLRWLRNVFWMRTNERVT